MRIGENPNRNKQTNNNNNSHRIIIPVYIPNLENYYKKSFQVFKMSISSLLKTKSINSTTTIVNNGCCREVVEYINYLFDNNKIEDVIHTENVGKINSILKAVRASTEPYITISDADILFKEHWLEKTVDVFNAHPKAGVVGIIPQFKMYEYLGYNVIADNLFNSRLRFTEVKDKEGLKKFYKSLGWNDDYNKNYLKHNLSITDNNITALIGSGHCVATYKKSLFDNNVKFSKFVLGGDSERVYLDEPCVKKNLWRLTTEENLAYHMGNTTDETMKEYLNNLKVKPCEISFKFKEKTNTISEIKYLIKTKLIHKLFKIKTLKTFFFKRKGLPKETLNNY